MSENPRRASTVCVGARLVCSHPHGDTPRGSAYKYYSWLAELYGAVRISRASVNDLVAARPDLVFCHGDRHTLYRAALRTGIPYVLCEQDVSTLRTGLGAETEREMLERAVGVLFTSEDHEAYLRGRGIRLPPSIVVHLRPRVRDLLFEPLPKLPGKHLVYAGGLIRWSDRAGGFGYRAYHRIFEAFIRSGWTVHVYSPASSDTLAEYAHLGCVIHPYVQHGSLYREMSQYTAAFHGYANEGCEPRAFAYTQACRPNKTWDGLGAGIPTISVQGGNSAKVIAAGGWGVTLPDLAPQSFALCEPERLPAITDEMRFAQTLEQDEERFRAFVEAALLRAKSRRLSGAG